MTQRELMTARRTPKPTTTPAAAPEGTINYEEKIQDLNEVTGTVGFTLSLSGPILISTFENRG